MHAALDNKRIDFMGIGQFLLPILLFCLILIFEIPYYFSQLFHGYSVGLFLIILLLYYLTFWLSDRYRLLASFGLTLLLFALTLSFMWTSGFSDNKVIAGLLPYKDGAGYYLGANLILNGLPLESTLQAGWRPLFPGFLSSMLFIADGNLKIVLSALVLLAGIGSYFASRQVYAWLGAFPASLFITFLYFYIQPLIGLTMTELLGFAMGCMAFAILWMISFHPRMTDLILGILLLVLAMSVRAGTFLMLPFMTVWVGRVFRGKRSFSWRSFAISWVVILLGYFAANTIYVRLIGVPEGKVFGNFAYSLYGQVQGGTGWHKAIEELGTRDPSIIYKAAFQFFLDHPLSLFIGILKSYRDFFMPFDGGIFVFNIHSQAGWSSYILWGAVILLMIRGLIISIKNSSSELYLLLLAGFAGIVLSIPFLPPIDGGSRFYASTVPFFFIMPVVGLAGLLKTSKQDATRETIQPDMMIMQIGSIVLSFLTVVTPVMILNWNSGSQLSAPSCSPDEKPFVTRFPSGSYVDLVSDPGDCSQSPEICLGDFEKNGTEKKVDDFFQKLYSLAQENNSVRVQPAVNIIDGKLKYFLISQEIIRDGLPHGKVSGCAVGIETINQTIYQVESIIPNEE